MMQYVIIFGRCVFVGYFPAMFPAMSSITLRKPPKGIQ